MSSAKSLQSVGQVITGLSASIAWLFFSFFFIAGFAPEATAESGTRLQRPPAQAQSADQGIPDSGVPNEVPESFQGDPRSGNQSFKTGGSRASDTGRHFSPDDKGAESGLPTIHTPKQASEEPDDSQEDDNPAIGGGSGQPFNLGARKSFVEGDASDNTLQGGAAQVGGALRAGTAQQGKMPAFNLNAQRAGLEGGTQSAGLLGGAQTGQMGLQPPLKGNASGTELKGGLNQTQLAKFANHDMVLIIDCSGSMRTPDCPVTGINRTAATVLNMLMGASISRWDWCKSQTLKLAQETQYVCSRGFTVVLFANSYKIYSNVSLNQIPQIFAKCDPSGGTSLHDPLNATLVDYFQRREALGRVKPLAIAVITDGRPNSTEAVNAVIVNATKYMKNPNEVSITFFLIGNKILNGQAYIADLEQNQMHYGAKYPIVRSVNFWNLEKIGLPRTLADTLSE